MKFKTLFLSKCKPEYKAELLRAFSNYGSIDGDDYALKYKDQLIEDYFKKTGFSIVFSNGGVSEKDFVELFGFSKLPVSINNDRELTNIVFPVLLSNINFELVNDLIFKIKNNPLRLLLYKATIIIPRMKGQLGLPLKGVVYYAMKSHKKTFPNLYSQALLIEGSEEKVNKIIDDYVKQLIKVL